MAYVTYMPYMVNENKMCLAGGTDATARIIGASCIHSWTSTPDSSGVEAVPMLWSAKHFNDPIRGKSAYLMWDNEPDNCPSQACMSPEASAENYHRGELAYPQYKFVAPVPSQKDVGWLTRWRNAYFEMYQKYPRIDVLAFHCYTGTAAGCIYIAEYFKRLAQEWHVPEVWCTEVAFLPIQSYNYANELRQFKAWAEINLDRYFIYISYNGPCPSSYWNDCRPAADPSLFRSDMYTLTDLGRLWYKDIAYAEN